MWGIEGQRQELVERFGLCFAGGGVSESDGGGAAGSVPKGPCVCFCACGRTRRTEVGKGGSGAGRAGLCRRHVVLAELFHCWGSGDGGSRLPAGSGRTRDRGGVGKRRKFGDEQMELRQATSLRAAPVGSNSSLDCADDVISALSFSRSEVKAENKMGGSSWSFWGEMDWGW